MASQQSGPKSGVDYGIWSVMPERAYQEPIWDVDELAAAGCYGRLRIALAIAENCYILRVLLHFA